MALFCPNFALGCVSCGMWVLYNPKPRNAPKTQGNGTFSFFESYLRVYCEHIQEHIIYFCKKVNKTWQH